MPIRNFMMTIASHTKVQANSCGCHANFWPLLNIDPHYLNGVCEQISDVIKEHPGFAKDLDWSARPGTKTYPRWKDALIGCFKAGRYPHLVKTERKRDGLNVYLLDEARMPAAVAAAAAKALSAAEDSEEGSAGRGASGSDQASE